MAKQSEYTFYPFVRQGIAANIEEKDNFNNKNKLKKGGGRATYSATIKLTASPVADNESAEAIEREKQKKISMFGPGEVIGINRRAIIRTEPRNNITNFEPHHLAFIDFYDEDFSWRYTPAAPPGKDDKNARLRPWLVLVVCEEQQKGDGWDIQLPSANELESNEGKTVMLPYLERKTADIAFPPPKESWAWAHVHANRVKTGTDKDDKPDYKYDNLEELIDKAPNRACSRLFCATRLKENTSYHAFLLPAFEQGRLAGLGADKKEIYSVPTQLASWDDNHQTPEGIRIGEAPPSLDSYKNKWPIYHQWYFKTGKSVDFEYLVRLLEPRVLDERVGTRPLDISSPGWGLKYNTGDSTILLQGAMKRPGQEPKKFLDINTKEHNDFIDELSNILNLNYANTFLGQTLRIQLQNKSVDFYRKVEPEIQNLDAPNIYDDPIITPPLYGRFHALKNTVNKTDNKKTWFKEVNLDPGMRAVAGLGARVVQKKQEEYMHRAWLQVERIIKANKARNRVLLGKQLSKYTQRKYLDNLELGKFLNMTFKLHSILKLIPSELTALKGINQFLSPAFTRIARPGGPRFKSLNIAYTGVSISATYNLGSMVNINQTTLTGPGITIPPVGPNILDPNILNPNILDTGVNLPGGVGNINLGNIGNMIQRNTGSSTNQESNQDNPVMRSTAYMRMGSTGGGEEEDEKQTELLVDVTKKVKAKIDPEKSYVKKMKFMLNEKQNTTTNNTQQNTPKTEPLIPVMAYPNFPEPIYEALNDLSQDFLLPNIHLIQPNTVSILETNQAFIEAYMLGVNYEMARELHWREYPTDRRGSYFRQFWDVEDVPGAIDEETGEVDEDFKDIMPIHTWKQTLGNNKPGDPDPDNLVLVIRGELLKKFPNAYIYMRKAVGTPGKRVLSESEDVKLPIFEVNVEPDIFFIGFDISEEEAKGNPGWFIVIEERPGEIRFGFDLPAENLVLNTTDDLDWGVMKVEEGNAIDLSKAPKIEGQEWAKNAAHIAKALYQKPYRAAIHASVMIP